MRRWPVGLTALLVAVTAALGCSALGDPGGMPEGLPHGGTGQFRLLSSDETGIVGSLPGRALALRGIFLESAMRVDDALFYVHAEQLDMPPMVPDDHPENEVFVDAFGPRTIHRAARFEAGVGAFMAGPEVLVASETWEDGEVFDPWVLVDADGTARLYYAAAGGIGVAVAPALDAAFEKRAGPILGPDGALVPRRPSVVIGPDDAYWMYYQAGDGIGVARSDDGERFSVMDGLTIAGSDELAEDNPEVGVANPGAMRVETRAGRTLIRVYFESMRADGIRQIYLMASEDGLSFDRFERAVMEQPDVRFPAPYFVDDRVTFLYANLPFVSRGFQTRAVAVAAAPAGESFVPEDESM